jgi:hypothetical protein
MENKYFHYGFYRDTLKRIKKFSIIIIALSFAYSALVGIIMLSNYKSAISYTHFFEVEIISLFDMVPAAGILTVLLVPLLTYAAFSYLFKRNESDFFECLPIKRSVMALSGVVAAFSVFIVTLLGSALVFTIVTIPCIGSYYTIDLTNFTLELFAVIIAAMLGSAVTMIAVSISGTDASAIVSSAALLIIPRSIMGIFTDILKMLNPMLVSDKIIFVFNSQINLYYSLLMNDFKPRESAFNYVYSLALAIVCLIIGIALMNKRGSEWVSQAFVKNAPRHCISILISSLPMVFSVQCLFYDDTILLGILLGIVSVAFLFICEKVYLSKGDKNRGGLIAFVSFTILFVLTFAGVILTDAHLASYMPESDEIEYVSIMYDEGEDDWLSELYDKELYYEQYVAMRAERIKLSQDEVKKIVSSAIKEGVSENVSDKTSIIVKVKTASGVDYRKIYITNEEYDVIFSALESDSEYDEIWLNITDGAKYPHTYFGGFYIYADALGDILSTMENEIKEIGVDVYRDGGYEVCSIEYAIYTRGEKYIVSIPVYDYMEKTIQKLESARKNAAEKEMSDFKANFEAVFSSGNVGYSSVSCYTGDVYYYINLDNSSFNHNEFLNDLDSIITTEYVDGYEWSMNFYITEGGMFGTSYYYTFDISDEVTLEQLDAFFRKHGYVPEE